jgi:hypothetical protein
VRSIKNSKHYFIYHDGSKFSYYDKYLFFGDFDPERSAIPADKRILLPRPLIDYTGTYPVNLVPTIGSFGFAFNHKQYHKLVKLVNDTFDKAVINLHIPNPYFGDTPNNKLLNIVTECRLNNTNPEVKLNISTNFMDDQELLTFLAGNDINVFYYGDLSNPGLSSAPDYALSVQSGEKVRLKGCAKPSIDAYKEASEFFSIPSLETFYGDKQETDGEFARKLGCKFIYLP